LVTQNDFEGGVAKNKVFRDSEGDLSKRHVGRRGFQKPPGPADRRGADSNLFLPTHGMWQRAHCGQEAGTGSVTRCCGNRKTWFSPHHGRGANIGDPMRCGPTGAISTLTAVPGSAWAKSSRPARNPKFNRSPALRGEGPPPNLNEGAPGIHRHAVFKHGIFTGHRSR